MVFELIGCGFNAHSQLRSLTAGLGEDSPIDNFPDDLSSPRVLAVGQSLNPVFVGWSDFILERDGDICYSGAHDPINLDDTALWKQGGVKVTGNHSGPICAISESSGVFLWVAEKYAKPRFVYEPKLGNEILHIAVAGNGRVCVAKDQGWVFAYRDCKNFLSLEPQEREWSISTGGIIQLAANESSFTLLTTEGEVYTWGDPRYSLGRDITEEHPAIEPSIISALEGLRMVKISSGGWLTAALSEERDLYIWGQAGNDGAALEFLPDLSGEVGLVDLGEGIDILDVAVGAGHVCVLTDGGDIYTAGRNENGQTGHAGEGGYQGKWAKWERVWEGNAMNVYSGPFSWNSFVVVEKAE